jgi:hypothetical protein
MKNNNTLDSCKRCEGNLFHLAWEKKKESRIGHIICEEKCKS